MPRVPPREGFRLWRQEVMGSKLKQARLAQGLSLQDVANHFGRSRNWLHSVEAGRNGIDAIDLQQLAEYYDYPVAFFIDLKFDARMPAWPKSEAEWALLAGGDHERAHRHYETDKQIDADRRKEREGNQS